MPKYVIVGRDDKFAVMVFKNRQVKCSYQRPTWLLKKDIAFQGGTIADEFCEASFDNLFLLYYYTRWSMKKSGYSWECCVNQNDVINKIGILESR